MKSQAEIDVEMCGRELTVYPPESEPPVRISALLEGWSVERRSYGVGTCFGGSGDVLCYGKWGVIGGTGRYKILFPSGWIEERPKFKTELEAMLWVMAKGKLKPSNDEFRRTDPPLKP